MPCRPLSSPPPISTASAAAASHQTSEEVVDNFIVEPFNLQNPLAEPAHSSFRLPWPILGGEGPILGLCVLRVQHDFFSLLIRHWIEVGITEEAEGVAPGRRLPLRAGTARGDTTIRMSPVSAASRASRESNL